MFTHVPIVDSSINILGFPFSKRLHPFRRMACFFTDSRLLCWANPATLWMPWAWYEGATANLWPFCWEGNSIAFSYSLLGDTTKWQGMSMHNYTR